PRVIPVAQHIVTKAVRSASLRDPKRFKTGPLSIATDLLQIAPKRLPAWSTGSSKNCNRECCCCGILDPLPLAVWSQYAPEFEHRHPTAGKVPLLLRRVV